jgi:hypothetical protein
MAAERGTIDQPFPFVRRMTGCHPIAPKAMPTMPRPRSLDERIERCRRERLKPCSVLRVELGLSQAGGSFSRSGEARSVSSDCASRTFPAPCGSVNCAILLNYGVYVNAERENHAMQPDPEVRSPGQCREKRQGTNAIR